VAIPVPAPEPTPEPPAAPAVPTVGPGTYVVGSEMPAGTWHTAGPDPDSYGSCYYARLRNLDGETISSIITNGNTPGPMTLTIKPSDKGFETTCVWTKTG
jgi:hypothetical protein